MIRYKLHLVILDNTDNCKVVLLDNLSVQLLHTPCIELTGPIAYEVCSEINPNFYLMFSIELVN